MHEKFLGAFFKRYVGVKRQTFQRMILIVQHHTPLKLKSGRPNELGVEDLIDF
ncbi:MAG: hypothetical protein RM347_018285 [Nostoc sp. ChiQUE02]|uniref:hypothetical protein n=1 Tax=Nostoc sp. ChiQUE02 TaxID=3075377 RepID=UPI002AD2F12D|nr:hypothetical protein [Nostoc sp. ChiQUE02]MDZ8233632.1 hypothetical protein [Nostoc sp. ChiQUE02]